MFFVYRFPQGLEDVSKYPALIQELLHRNWTENELANVLRNNFLRVFEEVERVSYKTSLLYVKEQPSLVNGGYVKTCKVYNQ